MEVPLLALFAFPATFGHAVPDAQGPCPVETIDQLLEHMFALMKGPVCQIEAVAMGERGS